MLIILLYKLFLNFLRLEVIEFMFLFILGFFGEFFSLIFEFFDFEKFEGDLYDKMIDMDRNYRNYCGFDKDFDVKIVDFKVFYF